MCAPAPLEIKGSSGGCCELSPPPRCRLSAPLWTPKYYPTQQLVPTARQPSDEHSGGGSSSVVCGRTWCKGQQQRITRGELSELSRERGVQEQQAYFRQHLSSPGLGNFRPPFLPPPYQLCMLLLLLYSCNSFQKTPAL